MPDAADAGPPGDGGEESDVAGGDVPRDEGSSGDVTAVDVVADVLVVLGLLGATGLIAIGAVPAPSSLRAAVGLVALLVLPGYAFTTAAFPARKRRVVPRSAARAGDAGRTPDGAWWTSGDGTWTTGGTAGLRGVERAALSFGLSVALMPVYGIAVSWISSGAGLGPRTSFAVVTAVVVALVLVGAVRRLSTPPTYRYALGLRRGADRFGRLLGPGAADPLLNLALVLGILVASAGFGAALVAPQDGSSYTSVSLLTEGEDGRMVSYGFQTEFERGESAPVTLEVENREGRTETYSVVVALQRVDDEGVVVESATLDRYQRQVDAGGRVRVTRPLEPTLLGTDLRAAYLVYRQPPPENPGVDSAYRYATLSLNVTAPGAADGGSA